MNKTRNGFLVAAIVLLMLGVFGCENDLDSGNGIDGLGGFEGDREIENDLYTVKIEKIGAETGDTVTVSHNEGASGATVKLNYTVANTAKQNLLEFEGVSHAIEAVDSAENGTRTYTINAADAKSGIIIIKAEFIHTDLETNAIAFNDTTITKTYGDAAFTNAVKEGQGSGAITYSSSNPTIAAVDSSTGEVTIRKAGSAVITAKKAADDTYAVARNKYTLTIDLKPVTITGVTVPAKIYDGTTTATFDITKAVINGKINNDDVKVAAGTAAFADKNRATNKIVKFSGFSLNGTDAGNYTLSAQPADGKANITVKTLTITGLTVADKSYDGTTTATVDKTNMKIEGVINGDVVDFNNDNTISCSASFSDAVPGKDKTVIFGTVFFGFINSNGGITSSSTSKCGNYNGTIPTGIKANIIGLSLPQSSILFAGTSKTLPTGINHTVNTIKWSSSDTSVVTVNNGKITAVKFGSAVITATTQDNVYTRECTVKVIPKIDTVLIPAGSFMMGSSASDVYKNNYTKQHFVTLTKNFYIGKYEVTQAQWDAVMDYAALNKTTDKLGKGDNYPIYNVSQYAMFVFCNKLSIMEGLEPVYSIFGETDTDEWGDISIGNNTAWSSIKMDTSKNGYRLPTDAEWEYAARGDYPNKDTEINTTLFGIGEIGDGTKMLGGMANFNTLYYWDLSVGKYVFSPSADEKVAALGMTAIVGSYKPNNYGLYDMHGNVAEACWGDRATTFGEITIDPEPVNTTGKNRGGYYGSTVDGLQCASHGTGDLFSVTTSIGNLGFRVVRTAPTNAQ